MRQFRAVFMLGDFYSNEADKDNGLHQTPAVFLKVAVRIAEEGEEKKRKE